MLKRGNQRESSIVRQKLEGLRPLDYEVTLYAVEIFTKLLDNEH